MTLDSNIFNDVYLNSSFSSIGNSNLPLTPISKMLVSLDGIHSGVPTRTTATLTPTTLRNIEQTFFELTNDPPTSVPCQAGFVAPLPTFSFEQDHQDHSLGSTGSSSDSSSWQTSPPAVTEEVTTAGQKATRRNMGGRRPKHPSNLTPEEEAKRKVRRERNKLAAARCRKRRVDQTNDLVDKVNQLEKEKQKLQSDIQELQLVKEDLEYCLDNHRAQCRLILDKIKAEPIDPAYKDDEPPPPKRMLMSNSNPVIAAPPSASPFCPPTQTKPNRPSSLNVFTHITPSQALSMNKNIMDIAGVPITTPSTGVFNYDSLMDGGTGLTPVSQPLMPSLNRNPLELVTPTSEPSKLVSL
ncbi:transcription factor kayak isoform X1 [Bradysia coprophila]|uniref:transcription factor kayak isoform X1 n=1 Tax=Bradysia coprophila TaxID=38358 RepID=UPI00187D93D3|nr:transcription factor kayak isoform X1 [Bradysia coprophila]